MLDKVHKTFRKVRDNTTSTWPFHLFCIRYCNNDICFLILGAPEITGHPESKTVINGSNVTFSCNASGYSTVSWTKNGSFLRTNANSRISFGRLNKTLTIRNVISEDSGQYRCVVFNGSSNASSDAATLNVLCENNPFLFYF